MNNDYTDVELRFHALAIAERLVNTEVQRVLGKCNTESIALVTQELLNIIKYGTVMAPKVTDAQPELDLAPEPQTTKFA